MKRCTFPPCRGGGRSLKHCNRPVVQALPVITQILGRNWFYMEITKPCKGVGCSL